MWWTTEKEAINQIDETIRSFTSVLEYFDRMKTDMLALDGMKPFDRMREKDRLEEEFRLVMENFGKMLSESKHSPFILKGMIETIEVQRGTQGRTVEKIPSGDSCVSIGLLFQKLNLRVNLHEWLRKKEYE